MTSPDLRGRLVALELEVSQQGERTRRARREASLLVQRLDDVINHGDEQLLEVQRLVQLTRHATPADADAGPAPTGELHLPACTLSSKCVLRDGHHGAHRTDRGLVVGADLDRDELAERLDALADEDQLPVCGKVVNGLLCTRAWGHHGDHRVVRLADEPAAPPPTDSAATYAEATATWLRTYGALVQTPLWLRRCLHQGDELAPASQRCVLLQDHAGQHQVKL